MEEKEVILLAGLPVLALPRLQVELAAIRARPVDRISQSKQAWYCTGGGILRGEGGVKAATNGM